MPISKHETKMMDLQVQLRQNQAELQDYLADLNNWEADIKKKEADLKSPAGVEEKQAASGDLPPVRNTIHKKKLKKKKKEKPADPNKPKKISGFDFRAWDKFDVDKALEEVDKEDKKNETSSSEYETDEEWEMERKKYLAGQEKDKGNDFLKQGDLDKAVEAYTKGMEYDPTNAILPANRAMALLKQQKFAAAELDCTNSISLDPLYVKAYLRRAAARAGLGKLQEAVSDYNRVLDLEPTNKQAKTEIERLQKELIREKEAPVATTLTENEQGRVKPIYKPPEERSKKPLVRIPIEEIGLEQVSRPAPSAGQSDLTKKIVEKEKGEFDKLFSTDSRKISTESTKLKGKVSHDSDEIPVVEIPELSDNENEEEDSQKPQNDSSTQERLNQQSSSNPEKKSESNASMPKTDTSIYSKTPSDAVPKSESKQVKDNVSNGLTKKASAKVSEPEKRLQQNGQTDTNSTLPVPQTSFQFQADFKQLKNNSQSFFKYLQAIPPKNFPKLFGQSFDADILVTILKTLEMFSDRANVYEILNALPEVKRFSMAAMFLSQKDKTVANKVMDSLTLSGHCTEEEVAALKKKYSL